MRAITIASMQLTKVKTWHTPAKSRSIEECVTENLIKSNRTELNSIELILTELNDTTLSNNNNKQIARDAVVNTPWMENWGMTITFFSMNRSKRGKNPLKRYRQHVLYTNQNKTKQNKTPHCDGRFSGFNSPFILRSSSFSCRN